MKHQFRKGAFPEEFWPISLSEAITAESMVYMDKTAGYLKPLDSDANAANFVGVCMDEVPVNIYGVDSTPNPPQLRGRVCRIGQFSFKATAGDSYESGDKVFVGADENTVTSTVGGNTHSVGYVSGEQDTIATATATDRVLVCVRASYPATPMN